ncbi:MAG: Ger(x)C family spore germination C-terminal domain-containing protein [Clostridia bacterium]|nr:Ger(x)C family spore germination C-terminal domain-containing protein [Clostridia bacterium]
MRFMKVKIFFIAVMVVFMLFFSNDFGLIDIEKTAIITAVALDLTDSGEYKVTAQIAVPEATDTNTENLRAQISGTGATVGAAIKNIGDTSGWFPQLCFCNLIIVGGEFSDYNLIKILDYFSKTLRIQDSALIVMAENKADELLKLATPLDNISSFALQKIILKNAGLNRDVAVADIKSFCTGYYSGSASSYMPIVKIISQKEENQPASAGGGGSSQGNEGNSGGAKGDYIFNANTTALFYQGKKVGELTEDLTLVFNAITGDFNSTTFEVKGVETGAETKNYLLTVFDSDAQKTLAVSTNGLTLNVSLDIYAKISDNNGTFSDAEYSKNLPMPDCVKEKAEREFTAHIEDLIRTEIATGCDFLDVKQELYRKHHAFYEELNKDCLNNLDFTVSVTFSGQK